MNGEKVPTTRVFKLVKMFSFCFSSVVPIIISYFCCPLLEISPRFSWFSISILRIANLFCHYLDRTWKRKEKKHFLMPAKPLVPRPAKFFSLTQDTVVTRDKIDACHCLWLYLCIVCVRVSQVGVTMKWPAPVSSVSIHCHWHCLSCQIAHKLPSPVVVCHQCVTAPVSTPDNNTLITRHTYIVLLCLTYLQYCPTHVVLLQ